MVLSRRKKIYNRIRSQIFQIFDLPEIEYKISTYYISKYIKGIESTEVAWIKRMWYVFTIKY
jgi:hypothetical protein